MLRPAYGVTLCEKGGAGKGTGGRLIWEIHRPGGMDSYVVLLLLSPDCHFGQVWWVVVEQWSVSGSHLWSLKSQANGITQDPQIQVLCQYLLQSVSTPASAWSTETKQVLQMPVLFQRFCLLARIETKLVWYNKSMLNPLPICTFHVLLRKTNEEAFFATVKVTT